MLNFRCCGSWWCWLRGKVQFMEFPETLIFCLSLSPSGGGAQVWSSAWFWEKFLPPGVPQGTGTAPNLPEPKNRLDKPLRHIIWYLGCPVHAQGLNLMILVRPFPQDIPELNIYIYKTPKNFTLDYFTALPVWDILHGAGKVVEQKVQDLEPIFVPPATCSARFLSPPKPSCCSEGSGTSILSMAQAGSFSREIFQRARWSWAGSAAPDTFRFAL